MLISSGALLSEDKMAQHWSEFAANGKSEVKVGQVLAHTAGLSAWQDDMTLEDICDVEMAIDRLRIMITLFGVKSGTRNTYTNWNFGIGTIL
ncbi:hypothetical protein BX600DRAFT_466869 [Xylariales sp. PMI_506]|nr:hypothetical protein BX600DRAFT_466869 [Xylariales sp. PMI_506]